MLNEEVLDALQKVNVNLVFYGDNITISIQRDKPIDLIYRSAYDYFKPHGKVKLYYKNKELTPFLNYSIGKYFKKLKKIDILVKDTSRMDNMFDNQLLLNSDFNFEQLNKMNSKNTLQKNKANANEAKTKAKSNSQQNQRAITFCWDCKKFPINIFCRDCGAFVCKYCRMDLENAHYSHRTITLYPENLAKSAKLYKNILIEDLNEVEKINMNRNKMNKEKSHININIEEKKNHLAIKINKLINKINQIKSYQKEINYHINNQEKFKQKLTKAIKEVNNITNNYSQQKENNTENIVINNNNSDSNNNNISTNANVNIDINSKNNIKNLKEVFNKLNKIEKNTEKICKIGKTIKKWEEINKKLESSLKSVENKINVIIEEAGADLNLENVSSTEKESTSKLNNNTNNKEEKEKKEEKDKDEIKISKSKDENNTDNKEKDENNKEKSDENKENKENKENEEKKESEKDDDEYTYIEIEEEVEEDVED